MRIDEFREHALKTAECKMQWVRVLELLSGSEFPTNQEHILFFVLEFILLKHSWFTVCINSHCPAQWYGYKCIYIPFHFLFHYALSQDIEYGSLCYTIELWCLSMLYVTVRICYTCFSAILPNHTTLTLSNRDQQSVLYICVSFAVSHVGSSLPSF